MTREELDRIWASPGNWSIVYRCAEDPRIIVPRRQRWMGWTINFAHPQAWLVVFLTVAMAMGPFLVLLIIGIVLVPILILALVVPVVFLVAVSHWEASRSRE